MELKLTPVSVLQFGVFELALRFGELRQSGVRVCTRWPTLAHGSVN